MEAWKAGEYGSYNWTLTVFLQFARTYAPPPKDISKTLGVTVD